MFEKYLLEFKLLYNFNIIAFPLGILENPLILKNNPTLQILKSTPFLLKKGKSLKKGKIY
jgi:hypothetical protein